MAKGGSKGGGRYRGGGGVNPKDIVSETDMVSNRMSDPNITDDFLQTSRDLQKQYGERSQLQAFKIAQLKGRSAQNVLGYYNPATNEIAINGKYMGNEQALTQAYDECVQNGFHPSRGSKSAAQALASHEYGHLLTQSVANKVGMNFDRAANMIVEAARIATKHKGSVQLARKISEYATASNAETIAEALSDVYCNGSKAKRESKAIVNAAKIYLSY